MLPWKKNDYKYWTNILWENKYNFDLIRIAKYVAQG